MDRTLICGCKADVMWECRSNVRGFADDVARQRRSDGARTSQRVAPARDLRIDIVAREAL